MAIVKKIIAVMALCVVLFAAGAQAGAKELTQDNFVKEVRHVWLGRSLSLSLSAFSSSSRSPVSLSDDVCARGQMGV